MLFCIFKFSLISNYSNSRACYTEAYSEPSQTSKMELFARIIKGFQLLTIFIKSSILDIRLGFEYASEYQTLLRILLLEIYLVSATA